MCCKRGFLAKLGYSGVTSSKVEEELPPSAFYFPEQFLSSHPEVLMSSSSWKSSLSFGVWDNTTFPLCWGCGSSHSILLEKTAMEFYP